MAEAILDLRLDTVQPNRVRLVYGVQNDYNSRFLAVRFTVNGKPIDIENTAAVRINAKRPDGGKDAFPGTVNTDGTVKVPVAQWMLEVPGEVSASVTAVTSNSALTTQDFYIMAKPSNWDGTGTPSEEDPDKDVIQTIIVSENERVEAEKQRAETFAEMEERFSHWDDSIAPSASVTQTAEGANIRLKDKNGETTATVKSAYGSAKAGGYAGSEAEFAEDINPDNIKQSAENFIISELAKRGQLKPEFANSVDELKESGDTSKLYVLPDGYIYANMLTEKPAFTNVLSTAVGTDGKPYNGGLGYKVGTKISTTNVESEDAGFCSTGYIPAKPGDVIRIKNTGRASNGGYHLFAGSNFALVAAGYYGYYKDASRGYDTNPDANGVITLTMPQSATPIAYYRYTCGKIDETSIFTINEEITDETKKEYAWSNTGHAFVPADYEGRIITLENKVEELEENAENSATVMTDDVDILVPASDVAVVGREYNIYKNTIVFGNMPTEYYDVEIKINDSTSTVHNYHEVWRYTPTTAGTYTITITVRNPKLGNTAIYATKTMTLYVVGNATVSNKKVLFIGDSLTYAGKYEAEIQHNLSNGGIVSVGTIERTVSINNTNLTTKCEGRNSWATWDYAGTWADSLTKFQSSDNVFRNPSTNKFDLGYYMQKYHPNITLNAVCLNLGTNGVGATVTNVAGMSELISRIREYSATIPILVHIPIVEAPGDFYAYLGRTHTSAYMRMRWVELAEAFIKEYDGTMSNVHVVPVYFNLDDKNDFPKTEMAVSARNPATIERITDGHPNTYGYLKMADVYYAHLLKYMK